jgi:cation transport regulator
MPHALRRQRRPAAAGAQPPARHAQDIYRSAFNHAWQTYGNKDPGRIEEIAHRVAWAAVKKRFRKLGDAWVER